MAAAASRSPRPSTDSRRTFVGRERELALLRATLDELPAGRGRLILLEGEPGIGKTQLASEIAVSAGERGILVLWGRCSDSSGAPAFSPWAQILHRIVDAGGAAMPAILDLILPERGRLDADLSSAPSLRRFELFNAVATVLRRAAARQPLLLIFDDLHEADQPSLVLLRHVAAELHDAAILFLGNYRPADLERTPELAQLLNPIARLGIRLPIAALSQDQVADLVTTALGQAAGAGLLASLHRASGGNPLFVTELVHLLLAYRDATGSAPAEVALLGLPHGLREVIHERLRPLAESTRHLLAEAAVFGDTIDVDVLRTTTTLPQASIDAALDEAERAGIVAPVDRHRAAYRFRHELLRDVILAQTDSTERARRHLRVGEAYAEAPGSLGPDRSSVIAHHFARAVPVCPPARAIEATLRAAAEAERQWAYEDAERHYAQALRLAPQSPTCTLQHRCEILLACGRVQHAAGRATARSTFEAAAGMARQIAADDDACGARLLARAALGVADRGLGILQAAPDSVAVQLLEEALATLDPAATELHVRLRAWLAAHLSFAATEARSLELIDDALARARQLGDPATLAMVLGQKHLVWWRFNRVAGRLELANELVDLAERLGDRELVWQGRAWRAVDWLTLGEREAFDHELRQLSTRAEALRQPRFLWMALNLRTTRALVCGQWDEATALLDAAAPLGADLGDPSTAVAATFQRFLLGRERGEPADPDMLQLLVQRHPDSPMVRAALLMTLLDLGRHEEARAVFEHLATGDFALVREERRLGVLALLCEACWQLRDTERAPLLARLLEPFAAYTVMYSANACFGSARRFLGQMAALAQDWPGAEEHLAAARAANQRMGMFVPLAWSEFDRADLERWRRLCGAVDTPDGRQEAAAALERAAQWAERLDLARMRTRLEALRRDLALAAAPSGLLQAPTKPQRGHFRRDGEYWSIGDGRRLIRLKDSKGLQYIATLLAHPNQEIHVLDLVGSPGGAHGAGNDTAEPVLDAPARRAFRQRLADLREEIDRASEMHDLGQLDALQRERAEIETELSRSLGLHGRTRAAGTAVEKARLNGTRAIHTAVRRIAAADADLGRYFETTIKTGHLCLFRPDPRLPIVWTD